VAFDPYAPYGPVIETTARVVTWNVWGRYGDFDARQRGIEDTLVAAQPDVVCLVEAWATPATTQPAVIAERLGADHAVFEGGWQQEGWTSGLGIVSRWPISVVAHRALRGGGEIDIGGALFAMIDGPRGQLQCFVAAIDYPLSASAVRQAQVRELAQFVHESTTMRAPTIVCGDFNADPDSDEMRMLTGRAATPIDGLVFYDAWEMAGDGSRGITWDNANPLAAIGMYPNRRFDYILSAWPRANGAGHPVQCELLGVRAPDEPQLSDHYGVLADLRY
jgi:endonuclease/exonuclease/phosphatase family metal-dependent hydrolase